MKRIFTGIFVIIYAVSLHGQSVRVEDLMRIKPVGIGTVKPDTNTAIFLPMPFSSAKFITTYPLKKLPGVSSIFGIDLVYTRFREVDTFNQPELNRHRFEALKSLLPEIYQHPDIQWRVLEQRDATSKENAAKCFHGFIIYLKNEVPDSVSKSEVSVIKTIIDSYKDSLIWIPEKIEWKVKKVHVETGNYLPRNEKKKKAGIVYHSRGIWFRKPETVIRRDSSIRRKTGGYYKKISRFDSSFFRGTREFNLLTKRKWSKGMAVVTDVTGSMTPYSAQVLLWLKYNPEILKQGKFVFFNDGDNKPEAWKKTGSTGGIYFAATDQFDSVLNVLVKAMSAGTGGDLPENDLEAISEALKRWPDTDTVLLVADNQAAIKDISLLKNIHKPVSVLVCGAGSFIHGDYIKLTTATGGKLFALEQEVKNLKGIKTGTRIQIGTATYEFQKGSLIRIK